MHERECAFGHTPDKATLPDVHRSRLFEGRIRVKTFVRVNVDLENLSRQPGTDCCSQMQEPVRPAIPGPTSPPRTAFPEKRASASCSVTIEQTSKPLAGTPSVADGLESDLFGALWLGVSSRALRHDTRTREIAT